MLYDKNPPYIHYSHLPYSREPWKSLYVFQRLFTTLLLVPLWTLKYLVLPVRLRPRESWSLRQIIYVNFTRRIFKVTEVAGVTWGTRDPSSEPDAASLKDTAFVWVDPLADKFRSGILRPGGNKNDGGEERVPYVKVGCYMWPKLSNDTGKGIDLESRGDVVKLVGVFMHGGGYCHMSAHEDSRTSRIPRGLIERRILDEVYSVEYRLLQHAPFPAVVMDAAAVYAHVIDKYSSLISQKKCKVILVGDSSGGNLVLALARWIRDEGHLPMANGLLLLSPSSDPSHHLPETLSSHIPRPNKESDYLVDTPEPRALLQRTFLGFKYHHHRHGHRHRQQIPFAEGSEQTEVEELQRLMEVVHSEYVSPCSPIVLQRWGHEAKQDPEGEGEREYMSKALEGLQRSRFSGGGSGIQVWRSWKRVWSNITSESLDDQVEITQQASEEAVLGIDDVQNPMPGTTTDLLDFNPNSIAGTSTTTTTVVSNFSASGASTSSSASLWPSRTGSPSPTSTSVTPGCNSSTPFLTLFAHFPRTHIVIGTAERLTREVASLISAMEKDGVDVNAQWVKDACHDVLMVPPAWWDKNVVEGAWEGVGEWASAFRR